MDEPQNGYEYLEMMRAQNKKQFQSFDDFSEYLEHKARKKGIPMHGQFEITPFCNLSCKMCYVHLTKDQMQGRTPLTADVWKELINQAFEAGMFQATLTGGECLTYPGFEELYLHLHSLGCQTDVMTNGILLDDERIRFFKAHPPALIQITLYGWNEDSYERVTGQRVFHRVMENIERVQEAGFPLMLSVTPNRFLGEDVFETIRTARGITDNIFVNNSLFVPKDEPWRKDGAADLDAEFYGRIFRFQQELKGIKVQEYPLEELPSPGGPYHECEECGLECGGGRSGFVINWKGEMCICNRMEIRAYPLRDGFSEAWKKIHEAAESWPRVAECRECAYEEVCDRCAARFLQYTDAGKRPEALCEKIRYLVSRGVLRIPQCDY